MVSGVSGLDFPLNQSIDIHIFNHTQKQLSPSKLLRKAKHNRSKTAKAICSAVKVLSYGNAVMASLLVTCAKLDGVGKNIGPPKYIQYIYAYIYILYIYINVFFQSTRNKYRVVGHNLAKVA